MQHGSHYEFPCVIKMPTIHKEMGFRFFFFSNEGHEPPHIHVEKADAYAKLWLEPIALAFSEGFTGSDLGKALKITHRNRVQFLEKWNDFFGNKNI